MTEQNLVNGLSTSFDEEDYFVVPASYAQQRMCFMEEMIENKPLYNIGTVVELRGDLQVDVLQAVLDELVERHETLRTTFHLEPEGWMQWIAPGGELPLHVHDLRQVEGDRQEAVHALALETSMQPYDLGNGPLIRVHLYQIADEEFWLVLSLHHIITDGWSMSVLVQELTALYEARVRGAEADLPELTFQYADFSHWQQEWLQGETRDQLLTYWREQLQSAEPLLALPTDRPRPAVQALEGALHRVVIEATLVERLQQLGQQNGATLFMTLLAAYKTLLYRYTNQEDLLVGTPIANRNHANLDAIIGLFVNTLVLRTEVAPEWTFREMLRAVAETTLGAYEHQDMPFEQIIDGLQVERTPGINPLFQTMFVMQNMPRMRWEMPGLSAQSFYFHNSMAKFDLTLTVNEQGVGQPLVCEFEYSTALFDRETIEQVARHFLCLLEAVAEQPDAGISRIPLLSEEERAGLTTQPKLEVGPESDLTLHQWFATQAARVPEHVAVVYEGETLTYRELDERSNRLAHYLQRFAVGPDVLVGISLERSLDMIVAILGVLKAGAAYVPLDPSIPSDRFAYILQDAGLRLLISHSGVAALENTASFADEHVLELDRDAELIARESAAVVESEAGPDHLAYVIYTSGSTGLPKGVLIPHRNVIRLFTATEAWYRFDEFDVWTLFHSFAFDFSVWEIWGALLYGGKLVVVPSWVARSPRDFYELMLQEGVTVLNQTPSAFRQLVHLDVTAEQREQLNLRYVIFGGEALELSMLRDWFAVYGDQRPQLVNMYGITETTVHVTYRPISWQDLEQPVGSLIGEPIPDLAVYVLDPHLQPVPLGVTGEMYVGGAGVARAYLNRPELNAERFIDNPFAPGERLYKSGDLARRLRNGDLDYKGRIDHQVKIRGFRIELGEIEWWCLQHPGIREAHVLVQEDASTGSRLVAYLAAEETPELVTALHHFLKDKLPVYMVPALFVIVEKMPLTHNGKIDRKALLRLETGRTTVSEGYEAPTTETERMLCEIWQAVLGVERVGVTDNFFALGGDSILSLRLQAETRGRGFDLSLQVLFQEQTVRGLAHAITQAQQNGEAAERAEQADEAIPPFAMLTDADRALLPDGLEEAYPMTLLQIGMLYHSDLQTDTPIYTNLNTYRLRAPFSADAWQQALDGLAQAHPILRTSFDLTRYSQPLQLVHRETSVPLVVEDWRAMAVAEREQQLQAWTETAKRERFDWTQAPLVRFTMHRLTDDEFHVAFAEHHAILDGWSVAALWTELLQRYSALVKGEAPAVGPAPRTHYREFVAAERAALASEQQRTYWTDSLLGASVHELPRLEGAHRTGNVSMRFTEVELPAALSDQLKAVAVQLHVPLKSVLLAAHLVVMQAMGGDEDYVAGLVANGRVESQDSERVLGLFLNTVPLRMQMTGGVWSELIQRTFAKEQEIFPYRRFPMSKIQEATGGAKLFEATFNFIHFHVVKDLETVDNIEVLEQEETSFDNHTLLTNFMLDTVDQRVRLFLQWNTAELSDEQFEQLQQAYRLALSHLVHDPQAHYEQQVLLAEQELATIAAWNDTAHETPLEETIHALIEQQVERTPDRIALKFGEMTITYRELNDRANQLARQLQKRGGQVEGRIGVCMVRSIEMVVSLVAVLKAGMAYVPLDPDYPEDRLLYMMEDAQTALVLTHAPTRQLASQLCARSGMAWIDLEAEADLLATESKEPVPIESSSSQLAYVLYTSGSTGRPKGVLVPHRGVVNRLVWMNETYELSADDRVLQKTPYSFDVSVWEFFCPLLVGATMVIAKPNGHKDPSYLAALIRAERITALHFVPTMLSYFLDEPEARESTSIRHVFCSGEELPSLVRDRFFELMPAHVRLHNLYGPTEASIEVTAYECLRGEQRARVPIGHPLFNTRIHLLDRYMKPVPIGVPGELHIGGVQVARGYLNLPEMTAEKFIADPFGTSEDRLYKTGDLARYLPDGAVEYLGRIDQQVKLRGLRIEIREIETQILQDPNVFETALILAEPKPGDKRLVAYVVPRDLATWNPDETLHHLRQQLPEYMVPSVLQPLDALPLLPNGKVNRRALPEPNFELLPRREGTRVLSTETERVVAAIWEQILGVDGIGGDDRFFDLGGQSLLAIRAISRIREALGMTVPLSLLFDFDTLSEFAAALDRMQVQQAAGKQEASPIVPIARTGDLPLSFVQQQMWLLEQLEPGTALYNIPMPLRLKGPLQITLLEQSLTEFVARHEILRATFHNRAIEAYLQIKEAATVQLPVTDLSGMPQAEKQTAVMQAVMAAFLQPFDLQKGPLYRFQLIRVEQEEHILAAVFHHLISDGQSLNVYLDELVARYQANVSGTPRDWPALSVQYVDYASWMNERLQGEHADRLLAYWKRQLANLPQQLPLQPDFPRTEQQAVQGEMYTFHLPAAKVEQVEAYSTRHGVTPFMTLLAAFNMLLFKESGQTDIVLGTPGEHRNQAELETMFGCFVNTLVLRTDLRDLGGFGELLQRVRKVAMEAYDHQELPFEKIVSELRTQQELASSLFQILFVLHGASTLPLQLPDGLQVEHVMVENRPPKFDMHFDLEPINGAYEGTVSYNKSLFQSTTIESLVRRFLTLLDLIVEQSDESQDTIQGLLERLEQAEVEHLLQKQRQVKAGTSKFRKFGK